MSNLTIEGGNVLFPKRGEIEQTNITVKAGRIESIGAEPAPETDTRLVAENHYVAPGFIDLQVNGAAGVDFLTCDAFGPGQVGEFLLSHGTTSFLGTIITNPIETMNDAIGTLTRSNATNMLGLHVEGPFLSPEKRGTHNQSYLLEPDDDAFKAITEGFEEEIKLFTFAPEVKRAEQLLKRINTIGAVPSIGHSGASYEETISFIDRGISSFTHLFNGMKGFHHREPGTVGAALNSNTFAGLIADGLHLSPGAVKLADRAKGTGKICLVTDAIAAAGMEDGRYILGDQEIFVEEGLARLDNGTIAGSTLTLEKAVKNYMEFTGVGLLDAIRTVTLNPARLLSMEEEIGTIGEASKADLVVLDQSLDVKYTIIGGEVVYKSENNSRA
ncbi:MAG: N-acetylglucosamine-6-phosphate deacetylase [Candidatus Bipolaricaulota bacterium]|nr:N-acetylglucosamine-6-phosphate deacetylase [Candidatus Bipolaricaulota bacterium]